MRSEMTHSDVKFIFYNNVYTVGVLHKLYTVPTQFSHTLSQQSSLLSLSQSLFPPFLPFRLKPPKPHSVWDINVNC